MRSARRGPSVPGTRGSRWALMSAHVTRRCHSAPEPPAPPKDSPPDQTGLSIPGWGISPLQLVEALASRRGCPRAEGPQPRAAGGSFPRKAVASVCILQHGQLYPIQGQAFSRNPQNVCTSAWPCRRHFVGHREKRRVCDARGSAPNRPRELGSSVTAPERTSGKRST